MLSTNVLPEKYNQQNAPLLGVPFSCKESIWCEGMPNSTGLVSRKNFYAPEDSQIVKNMRNSGGNYSILN
jgi:fatty acid amide hydrolase 2